MQLFDMHTHCFPDALAPKALPHLAEISKTPYFGSGTYDDLCEKSVKAGYTGFMILHIATKPEQMENVNRFAAACQKDRALCFGSVYPTVPEAVEALYCIHSLNLCGVKLHPDYQNFFVNDPRVFPVYETAAKLKLPITFHAGRDPYSPDIVHCTPEMLAEVSTRFPDLTIIAAHMGGMEMDADVEKHLVGRKNVYFDTAFATRALPAERCKQLIHRHGVEKILFATDFPWSTAETECAFLESLALLPDELSRIYYKNADQLFHISDRLQNS